MVKFQKVVNCIPRICFSGQLPQVQRCLWHWEELSTITGPPQHITFENDPSKATISKVFLLTEEFSGTKKQKKMEVLYLKLKPPKMSNIL